METIAATANNPRTEAWNDTILTDEKESVEGIRTKDNFKKRSSRAVEEILYLSWASKFEEESLSSDDFQSVDSENLKTYSQATSVTRVASLYSTIRWEGENYTDHRRSPTALSKPFIFSIVPKSGRIH